MKIILKVVAIMLICGALILLLAYWLIQLDQKKYVSQSGNNCKISVEYECNIKGEKCRPKYTYKYAADGSKKVYYSPHKNWWYNMMVNKVYDEIHVYDKDDRKVFEYLRCDKNFLNCSRVSKYEYDDMGNLISEKLTCKKDFSVCGYINRYEYDSNGNKIAEYFECGSAYSVYCNKANKFVYDSNGNNIEFYGNCDQDLKNCEVGKYNVFKNNKLIRQSVCDGNLKNCKKMNIYDYDSRGNMTLSKPCDANGANCSGIYHYDYTYDDRNNITEIHTVYETYKNNVLDYRNQYVEKFLYDENGNLLSDKNTDYKYDEWGKLIEKTKHISSYPNISKYVYICE